MVDPIETKYRINEIQDIWYIGNVSSRDFDLTLMILLLREVSGVTAPQSGWNHLPPPNDHSDGADLARIKHYRNIIAHATTCSISNYIFSNSWQGLSQAVIRVGGQGFTAEVAAMLTTALDQSYKELYRELKNLRESDIIPPNIQYLNNIKIEGWTEEDEVFVSTRATNAVTVSVDQDDVIMVSGPPGCGKSATVHHIALQLREDGYRICPVMSTKEIVDYWMPEVKQVFVFDDLFGVHGIDEAELNQWKKYQQTFSSCFQYSCMKILATVRSHIIKDEKITKMVSSFQHKSIDITAESNNLSNKERQEIFCKHAKSQSRDDLNDMDIHVQKFTISCFPLLCRIYAADKKSKHSIDDFFRKPLSVIGEQIDELQSNDPLQYFCLLFCMIYDASLNSSILDLKDESKENKALREDFLELCGIWRSFSRVKIKAKLDTLLNTFLKIEGNTYHFIHQIIHDAVVRHVGHLQTDVHEMILKYCSSQFLKERICLTSVECKNTELVIVLGQDLDGLWGDRLLTDVKNGHWKDVFSNECVSSEKGDEIITKSLQNLRKSDIVDIMCNAFRDERVIDMSDTGISIRIQKMGVKLSRTDSRALHWFVVLGLTNVVIETLRSISGTTKDNINAHINLLLLACLSGKENMVKLFIGEGYDVNHSMDGLTALGVSAYHGYDKVVKLLIDNGGDVSKCNSNGESPLYVSSHEGHDKVVKLLTEHGCDVNKCNKAGRSPLYVSSCYGYDKVVKLLIDNGGDVNNCNRGLFESSSKGHDKVVKLLIEHGCEVNKCEYFGCSPLYVSSNNGYDKIVKLLIENGADLNTCNSAGWSPLFISSIIGRDKVVKLLIDNGADVNRCYDWDESPLHVSSSSGHDKVVKLLIDNGGEVNKCNFSGETPLYVSSNGGYDKVVKLLIDNGGDVNKCNSDCQSPLYVASFYGYDNIVKMLIEHGSEVNKCNNFGKSPLFVSSDNGNDKVVKLLIDNGGDVNKCDKDGSSPLYVSSANREKFEKLVKNEGDDAYRFLINGFLTLNVYFFDVYDKIVKLLIDNGGDVNKCNNNGQLPLHISSCNCDDKLIKLLIDKRSEI